MRNPMMFSAALVALLIARGRCARSGPAKPPPPVLSEVVPGMPRAKKQQIRVIVATLERG